MGTEDTVNCKMSNAVGCNDNELATYCPAMLQGGMLLLWPVEVVVVVVVMVV